jgi:tetratricopeptide (TPR) repeat protein
MLSQEYINIGDYDNALSAIEYAVAISPDSAPILTTKAQILYDLNKDGQEAYRIVRDLVAHDKEYTPALFTLAAMYAIDGNEEGAASIIEEYLAEHPSEVEAIGQLLKLGDSLRNLRVLREYMPHSGKSQEEWTSWARSYYEQALWQPTSDILLTWLYAKGVSGDWNMLIESLYRQKRTGEITQLCREYLLNVNDPQSVNITFTTYLMLIFSLLRAGQLGAARNMADYMLTADAFTVESLDQRVQLLGAQSVLRSMYDDVFRGETIVNLDKIDPFITPSEASGALE